MKIQQIKYPRIVLSAEGCLKAGRLICVEKSLVGRPTTTKDPSAASSYNIEAHLLLSNLSDGSTRSEKNVSGKFEGAADGVVKKALEEGSRLLLKELN